MNAERQRLLDDQQEKTDWRLWGPYLSERQWGTVREDYSENGDAWNYFTHEQARSRTYRWGEDGLGGISDNNQWLCFAIAVWNGQDRILKERLFGLTGPQGNHGEDCKEIYYYLDATPTHSYLKFLYKYPLAEYPYDELIRRNPDSRHEPEFEIFDTDAFKNNHYVDMQVEYAKVSFDDVLIRLSVRNLSSETAQIRLLPQWWFRNIWSWKPGEFQEPSIRMDGEHCALANHQQLGEYRLYADTKNPFLFTNNESNVGRIRRMQVEPGYFKDAFHDYVIEGKKEAVNPEQVGTKCAVDYDLKIAPGQQQIVQLRLSRSQHENPFAEFSTVFDQRINEANEFYDTIQNQIDDADAKSIQRQAFAGLIWTKQFYCYDVARWQQGDPTRPDPPRHRIDIRNRDWDHLKNADVISMPDKWEYPWYAAWDLVFHCIPLAIDRRRICQTAIVVDAERMVHASQRSDSGIRMEFQ